MKKAFWLLLLALLLACGPSATETQPADTDNDEDTAVSETDTDSAEEAETEPEAESSLSGAANLDSFAPAATVEEAAIVREQDWRKGAADPIVVLIEYSDFQ